MRASRAGQKASALQAWARILLKPELGRVAEACQLLEQVALETIQMGGTYSQAQSKGCKNSCCCLLLDAKPLSRKPNDTDSDLFSFHYKAFQ